MIFINGRFLQQPVTGVQRFAREVCFGLAQVLRARGADRIPIVVPAGGVQPDLDGIDEGCFEVVRRGRATGHRWEQFVLSRMFPERMLINLCGTAPVFRKRQTVVLHDAAVVANPDNFGLAFRTWYRWMIYAYSRRAEHFVTVSEFSRGEIARYWGLDPMRIQVVAESGEHIKRAEAAHEVLARNALEPGRYILAVSSVSPNKNFGLVVKAMELLKNSDLVLAVAGSSFSRVFSGAQISGPSVKPLGYVSDGELRTLYENAAFFVYPSLYEGFGLPPLEAMESGCPVIVSDSSSIPEVCSTAALYCDPHSPESLADRMAQLWADDELRATMRQRGLERAAGFRWRACAERLLDIAERSEGGAK